MQIRLGYEIAIECDAPTAVVSLLDINLDRQKDIQRQTRFLTTPTVQVEHYADSFGNTCRRLVAPSGGVRILYDAVIEDSGLPDEVNTITLSYTFFEVPAGSVTSSASLSESRL